MNVHQGSDGDWSLQPELSCLGDEALAATQEKEGSSLVSSGLHSVTYPLAARSEGTGGILTQTWCTQEGCRLYLSIYSVNWLSIPVGVSC